MVKDQKHGDEGLKDLSRRPHHQPKRISQSIEEKVIEIREKTNYGKRRISYLLFKQYGLVVPESTVGKILRRNGMCKGKKRRKVFYPAFWSYEIKEPFTLAQVDTKDIYDKETLGTRIYTHITRLNLPRYQWRFLLVAK